MLGTVYGCYLFLFNIEKTVDNETLIDYSNVLKFIKRTAQDNHIADIQSIFFVPNVIPTLGDQKNWRFPPESIIDPPPPEEVCSYISLYAFNECYAYETQINKNYSVGTGHYTPKNNKCFVYPYNYLQVTNNQGNVGLYKYELSSDNVMKFETELTCSIGGSCRISPKNYNGTSKAIDMSVPLGKLPVCGWSSDTFTNWLTEQAVNTGSTVLSKFLGGVRNFFGMGAETEEENVRLEKDSTEGIKNILGNFSNTFLWDNDTQEGNLSATGDVNFTAGDTTFKFKRMRCKDEYMKQIDSYFSMFGYQINEIKTPNITGRTNYNFIKISSNDDIGYGNVPSKDLAVINKVCRRGVTIWHNHANLGNYSVTNTIVT